MSEVLYYLGRVRLGVFRNKNVFRNIFWLFCSWEQNSQNGIQVFRNENSSQTNAYLHYSNYSYSGLIPNERALKDTKRLTTKGQSLKCFSLTRISHVIGKLQTCRSPNCGHQNILYLYFLINLTLCFALF